MQTQFIGAITLRRDGTYWYAENETDGSEPRLLGNVATGKIKYIPDTVIRGITTNDKKTNGEVVAIDLPEAKFHEIRIYAELDRPYRVTAVYMNTNTDIQNIVLLK